MPKYGPGVFAGDYTPPLPWRTFGIKLHCMGNRVNTERTIGALTTEELGWVVRVAVGELERRRAAKAQGKKAVV